MRPNWRLYFAATGLLAAIAVVLVLWAIIRRQIRGW
jgi:hypothetical protein